MHRRNFLGAVAGFVAATSLEGRSARAADEPSAAAKPIPRIPGPDPDPKIPAFKVPAGAIDTHCHIFGPAAEYPFSATRTYTAPDAPLPMILKALPVPYVIDHMGTIDAAKGLDDAEFKALLELQSSDEKCWVKITGLERASATGSPFHDAVPFAKSLIDNAPDRVLWGTDWPHPNLKVMPNDGDIVDLIPLYAPDPAVQRKLLVTNPERLFKFSDSH
jgi:predicted TIM-barrel fold metal-dependent hydrolase